MVAKRSLSSSSRGRNVRNPYTIARARAASRGLSIDDYSYLLNLRQRTFAPRIDLTVGADRRFYTPERVKSWPKVRHPYAYARVIVVPERFKPFTTFRGTRSLPSIRLSEKLGFETPHRVLICIRRRRRREVLFSRGAVGSGKVLLRRGMKRTPDSEIRC